MQVIRPALGRLWAQLTQRERWKVHLGLGAGFVLAAGALLAPRAPVPVVKPPQDNAVPLLREAMQRRDTSAVFRNVPQVGAAVGDSVVSFLAAAAPAPALADFEPARPAVPTRLGNGLLVSAEGDVLSHVSAIGRRAAVDVAVGAAATTAHVVAYEPDSGLVLMHLEDVAGTPATLLAGAALAPGALAAAVSRPEHDPVATPVFVASSNHSAVTLAAFGEGLSPGTPIFSLEGAALAVVADGARTAVPVRSALDRLRRLAESGRGVPRTLGLLLQEVTPALRPLVGEVPVLVAGVEDGGAAERSGVRVGDGLVGVNGDPIADLAAAVDAIASLALEGPSTMTVLRTGRELVISVQATPTLAPPTALRLPPIDPEPAAGRLFSAAALASAGVEPDAVVIALDGRRMTERAAATYLRRRPGPRLLYVAQGGQRFFTVAEARP